MSPLINQLYRFGDFTLDTDQRVLLRGGKPVALTPKVFDTLLILVENRGRIVEKDELMRRLWPDTFVEESNITFNIQQLRKCLSDNARNPRFVGTVARRGYRFIADVEPVSVESHTEGPGVTPSGNGDKVSGNGIGDPVSRLQFSTPQNNVAVAAVPTSLSKNFIALAVLTLILLVGGGLLFWKLWGFLRNPGEIRRAQNKSSLATPLKVEKLTLTGQSRHVAISPDGKYVAYTRQLERESSIWLRQLASNTNVEIVPATGIIYGLAFATSGEQLYFVRGEPTMMHGSSLYRVSLLGGVPAKVVEKLEGNFSVSADDRQIAFVRRSIDEKGLMQYSLATINSDGTGERTVFVGSYPDRLDVPLWSPDGQSILCSLGYSEGGGQDASIVAIQVADGTMKPLSSEKFFRITKMAWLPGKGAILISARKNLDDNNQLWRVSYPGMETSRLTEELSAYLDLSVASGAGKAVASQATRNSDIWLGPVREFKSLKKITQAIDHFCWTPDGRLVYTSTAGGNIDLWIMHPDGTGQKQLTVNAGVNGTPVVTPDNRYIVFSSNRTGALQVWRMNLDGANQIQLTKGGPNSSPTVSADSRWVIYNTTGDWHLWKVSIDGGEPVQLTSYYGVAPAASPDGKMIACLGRDASKEEILLVPLEGGQPLKRIQFPATTIAWTRVDWTRDGKALVYAVLIGSRTAIFRQSLDGGPPEEIAGFEHDELSDFGYSHDGQFLAAIRCVWKHDMVMISDLNK